MEGDAMTVQPRLPNNTTERVFEYVRDSVYAPTIREIQHGLGISSTNVVWRHLNWLKDHGKVTWEPCKSRTLRVVGENDEEQAQEVLSGYSADLIDIAQGDPRHIGVALLAHINGRRGKLTFTPDAQR